MGQVDAIMEDEGGFHAAVGQEQLAAELRELVAVLGPWDGFLLCRRLDRTPTPSGARHREGAKSSRSGARI